MLLEGFYISRCEYLSFLKKTGQSEIGVWMDVFVTDDDDDDDDDDDVFWSYYILKQKYCLLATKNRIFVILRFQQLSSATWLSNESRGNLWGFRSFGDPRPLVFFV